MGKRKVRIVENVRVVAIAHKGMAIGKTEEGEAVLLSGGVPGDLVDFAFTRKKKGMKFGVVQSIKEGSPHRVEPLCEHFNICGGCKWQDLDYKEQIKQKAEQVNNAVRRIADLPDTEISPILAAPQEYLYRNKLEFTFSPTKWLTDEEVRSGIEMDRRALGFHKPASFDKIVDINHCHLQNEPTNAIRNKTRSWAKENEIEFYNPRSHQGILRNLMIRVASTGEVMVVLIIQGKHEKMQADYTELIKSEFPSVTTLMFINNEKKNDTFFDCPIEIGFGKGYIIEELEHVKFKVGPKSFFQTNTKQAEILYSEVRRLADLQGNETLLDLYCGVGSIGLFLAEKIETLIGIEQVPEAIEDAKFNAELNGINNAHFYVGEVRMVLTDDFMRDHGKPDIIITDPPRVGMHADVVEMLNLIKVEKLIYVSCNPATQARDLKLLSEIYEVVSVQPVDMFPHTSHVESIASLKLRK